MLRMLAGVWVALTMAAGASAQISGGLSTSAPLSGASCSEPALGGKFTIAYPAKPISITWRGESFAFDRTVWMNDSREHSRTVFDAYVAALGADLKVNLGVGAMTDMRAVSGGVLVATNAGEWGGGLVFVTPVGKAAQVIGDNTHALIDLGGSLYALTGLSHLGLDHGVVWRIDVSGAAPVARELAKLPGSPVAWAIAEDRAILIATGRNDVAVLPDGTIEPAKSERVCTGLKGLRE